MSESTAPQTRATPKPEEMPWVISYLHDDIQDLRQDLRTQIGAVNNRIDETNRSLSEQIHELNRSLDGRINETNNRIDEFNRSLGDRIDETNRSLGDRIDKFNRSLDDRINETNNRVDEFNRSLGEQIRALHKRIDTYFLWMMGTLVTITGVLIAVIKL